MQQLHQFVPERTPIHPPSKSEFVLMEVLFKDEKYVAESGNSFHLDKICRSGWGKSASYTIIIIKLLYINIFAVVTTNSIIVQCHAHWPKSYINIGGSW